MNIYIFGDESFKKQISKILEKSGIKYRLGESGSVIEVNTVNVLKDAILQNPKDIFLIDHDKIIVKNFLTTKIKFLNPKDGIEKVFLEDHGIGELSVDEMGDISQHIIKKLEAHEKDNGVCNIDNSITRPIFSIEEEPKIVEQIEDVVYEEKEVINEDSIGDVMEQLTQLDDINEADILDALSNIDGIKVSSQGDTVKVSSSNAPKEVESNSVEIDSSNLDDIAALLEQLKNNKTLEISIKIKS